MPARMTIASTGSERSLSDPESVSRSATNTGRGRWSTSSVRSHQSRIAARLVVERHDLAVVAAVDDLPEEAAPLRDRVPAVAADGRVAVEVRRGDAGDEDRRADGREQREHALPAAPIQTPKGVRHLQKRPPPGTPLRPPS